MGIYKVGSDGKAPQGLSQGDYVVTGGGTYKIDAVNNGQYTSSMYNPNQTTYNYKGTYDTLPNISAAQQAAQATSPASAAWGQTGNNSAVSSGNTTMNNGNGNTVTNAGQGTLSYDPSTGRVIRTMSDGRSWYVDPDAGKYNQIYQEYYNTTGNDPRGLYTGSAASGAGMMQSAATSNDAYIREIMNLSNALANAQAPAYQAPDNSAQKAMLDQYLAQLGSIEYNPVDYDQYMSKAGSLDEYYQQALDVLNPRYQSKYMDAYNKSVQNLLRAGLYDTVYGQSLMNQQQNAVTEALNADAAEMGQNLYQKALDRAYQAYQAAVQENQFGASFKQQNLTESGQLTMNYIGLLNDEAAAVNDYNMQAYLGKMQQYTAAIDAAYKAGSLTSAEYENMMNAAKIELSKVEQQLTQAQIANTEADTAYTNAKIQALNAEMAGLTSGGGSGYYSGGSSYYTGSDSGNPVVDSGSPVTTTTGKNGTIAQQGNYNTLLGDVRNYQNGSNALSEAELRNLISGAKSNGAITTGQATTLYNTLSAVSAEKEAPKTPVKTKKTWASGNSTTGVSGGRN